MSMNRRIQAPPPGDSGGDESSDLSTKDVIIMLVTAAVVVFIFGTLAMEGSDVASSDDDDLSRFTTETDPGDRRLDIDADDGYVRPGEAAGPRTGEADPEFDPHQVSARDVDEERLKQGDFSDFGGVSPDDVPEMRQSDVERVEELGAGFDRPTSAEDGWEMRRNPPTMDDIQDSMPSEVGGHVDFDEAQRRWEQQQRQEGAGF